MPLSPAEFQENLTRRFAETYEHDEQAMRLAREKLSEAVRLVVEHLGPRKVVLYGSLATGIFRAEGSDIDLAVEGLGLEAPRELKKALVDLFQRKVDLVDPKLVSEYVRSAIERKGEVLFEPR